MTARPMWLTNGQLLTPAGIVRGSVAIRAGRIIAIARSPGTGLHINVKGRYVSPGFIDLHIWGDPQAIASQEAKTGTTSFLAAIGPEPPELLAARVVQVGASENRVGARCLGIHLEGPFLNPLRAGALASRWLRPPTSRELRQLAQCGGERWKLLTIAPELPRGLEAIRWCARRRIAVSIGHSDASADVTQRAIKAGARAVTHVFNGMRSLHHRDPGLLGEVLTDDRLVAMLILDGVHVDPIAFQLLWRCKGPEGIVLVTDSIRLQPRHAIAARGAFYLPAKKTRGKAEMGQGVLAGSRLTMIEAVRNAVRFGKISVSEAVRMATSNPARLIGVHDRLGSLQVGKAADLVVFDKQFRVSMTLVDGQVVYQRR